jgi:hypothetical protein
MQNRKGRAKDAMFLPLPFVFLRVICDFFVANFDRTFFTFQSPVRELILVEPSPSPHIASRTGCYPGYPFICYRYNIRHGGLNPFKICYAQPVYPLFLCRKRWSIYGSHFPVILTLKPDYQIK